MDVTDDEDEDEFLDQDVQMIIQESFQKEHVSAVSARGGDASALARAIKQGKVKNLGWLEDHIIHTKQTDTSRCSHLKTGGLRKLIKNNNPIKIRLSSFVLL